MKAIKRMAHRLFRYSGFDFLRYDPQNFACLRRAKILGTRNINLVMDIGADEGNYPVKLWECGYGGASFRSSLLNTPFQFFACVRPRTLYGVVRIWL